MKRMLAVIAMIVMTVSMTVTSFAGTDISKKEAVKIALRNANKGLKVWAVAPDGTRLRQVPATYEGGVYHFTAKIAAGEGANAPTMVYELAAR